LKVLLNILKLRPISTSRTLIRETKLSKLKRKLKNKLVLLIRQLRLEDLDTIRERPTTNSKMNFQETSEN